MYVHVKENQSSDVASLPFDVLLTTYDIALVDQDFLSQIPWYRAGVKPPAGVLFSSGYANDARSGATRAVNGGTLEASDGSAGSRGL
ncbi:hypothetical protein ACOSQ2_002137 [Xanthoceras sorbifolium]